MKAPRVIFKCSPPAWKAFTLVEVLVSMTVLSIIVIMLTSLLNSTLKTLSSTNSDQERHRSGRALTDFIGKELRAAMLPAVPAPTLPVGSATPPPNLQMLINPTQIKSAADSIGGSGYSNADSIFWQAPLATDTTYGDIAEVGYFVKWVTKNNVSAPVLCRFFVNPSVVSASAANPTVTTATQNTTDFLIYKEYVNWLTKDLIDKVAPADNENNATTGKTNGYAGLFAENVLGMWVQSYGIDGSELSLNHGTFDSRNGYSLLTGQSGGKGEQRYLPALIRVSIAQIDSKYAVRLSPAIKQIRDAVSQSANATEFLKKVQPPPTGSGSGAVLAISPGIRTYSTDVFLDNAR